MRLPLLLAPLATFAACDGDSKDKGPSGTGDTAEPPPSFTFRSTVPAKSYEATIPPEVVTAHKVSGGIFSGMGMVASDDKVQDRMNTDAGSPPALRLVGGSLDCWARPEFPRFSFTLDYTGCEDFGVSGGIFVEDHPSGPLLFNFLNWKVNDRTVGGTLALDTRGANPSPYYWQAYNTDSLNPSLENAVPLGVTVASGDGRTNNPTLLHGGARLDLLNQRFLMWGTVETGPEDARITVVHGGRDAADVAPDDPPADAVRMPLNWLSCRCPISGTSTYPMPLDFAKVVIDVDDFEDEPDEIDDPEVEFPVSHRVEGVGLVTYTGCGEYDVAYETDDATLPLSKEALLAALSFQCQSKAIEPADRCAAMVQAANDLPDVIDIAVAKAEVTRTALDAVGSGFDVGYCKVE